MSQNNWPLPYNIWFEHLNLNVPEQIEWHIRHEHVSLNIPEQIDHHVWFEHVNLNVQEQIDWGDWHEHIYKLKCPRNLLACVTVCLPLISDKNWLACVLWKYKFKCIKNHILKVFESSNFTSVQCKVCLIDSLLVLLYFFISPVKPRL